MSSNLLKKGHDIDAFIKVTGVYSKAIFLPDL